MKTCCYLIVFLFASPSIAQENYSNPFYGEGGILGGNFFFNAQTPRLGESRITGFYLSVIRPEFRLSSFQPDQRLVGGLRLTYLDFNNPILGVGVGIQPFIRFPLLRTKFSLSPELGFGAIYTTRHFDLETNNQNLAIGAPLSFHISARLVFLQRLSSHSGIVGQLGIDHLSNGSIVQPNFGMNTWYLSLGYQRFLKEGQSTATPPLSSFRNALHAYSGAGFRQYHAVSNLHPIFELGLIYSTAIVRWARLNVRLDFVMDYSTRAQTNEFPEYQNTFRRWEAALGGEWVLGRLRPFMEVGFFLTHQPDFPDLFYRIGLKVRLSEKVYAVSHVIAFQDTKSSYAIVSGIQYAILQK